MAEDKTKGEATQSEKSSQLGKIKAQIPSIGDSKESMESLRRAMEIPPRTGTDKVDKKK